MTAKERPLQGLMTWRNKVRNRSGEPGPDWSELVAEALKNLNDAIALSRSPLARLNVIEKYSAQKSPGRTLRRGLGLQDLLRFVGHCGAQKPSPGPVVDQGRRLGEPLGILWGGKTPSASGAFTR
ncbi:unnamed protein product [marine sediment metagenome]|uniref:Uncharacterized protein n=1 Tax=marine sediment metagenome TaxID=412755 RepID=X0S0R9_9ZZZZ